MAIVAAAQLGVFIQSAEFAAFGFPAADSVHRYTDRILRVLRL